MKVLHFLALDGGGTGCRAMLCAADGRELGRAMGGGANLTSDFKAAHDNIHKAIGDVYQAAGLPQSAMSAGVAVLGVAGADIGNAAARLQAGLGFAKSLVVSDRDTTIAGVLGQGDGTLAQIGTGSFFVHRHAGVTRHAGGWGLVLGDECSGAWLGRELLRATLRAHDGVDAGSPLAETVMKDFDGDTSQLVLFARDASAADFASYAPRLFSANDTGDELAGVILRHAVSDLERTLTGLEAASFPPLYLCGGVGERYAELLDDTFRARITKPEGDGLGGALSMAMALHAN